MAFGVQRAACRRLLAGVVALPAALSSALSSALSAALRATAGATGTLTWTRSAPGAGSAGARAAPGSGLVVGGPTARRRAVFMPLSGAAGTQGA